MHPEEEKESFTISDLAKELDISARTIRFYEEKGFISPERGGNGRRIYDRRDRARIKLILRGKRFGHTLNEIAEMIGPASPEMDERDQIRQSLAYGEKNLQEIRNRIEEMKMVEEEIIQMRVRLIERLAELNKEDRE